MIHVLLYAGGAMLAVGVALELLRVARANTTKPLAWCYRCGHVGPHDHFIGPVELDARGDGIGKCISCAIRPTP